MTGASGTSLVALVSLGLTLGGDQGADPGRTAERAGQVKAVQTRAAQKRGLPKTFTNSVGMTMVYIKPGTFLMGARDSAAEVARKGNTKAAYFTREHPQHRVTLSNGFHMSAHEVTQEQYEKIMGTNPSYFKKGGRYPVETVSWVDAVEFCKKLSATEGAMYRLPTEAEWEYACRAGTTKPFAFGETISTDQANYDGDYTYGSGSKGEDLQCTTPAGTFKPNAWGLYDMHGNVGEWCQDWYAEDYYAKSPKQDPAGPTSGERRVLRGGSQSSFPCFCRAAFRNGARPIESDFVAGFRVVSSAGSSGPASALEPSRPPVARPVPIRRSTPSQPATTSTNSIGMTMVHIRPGTFLMGSPDSEKGRSTDERPQRRVRIGAGFRMSAHEVTQGQYEKVMGANPSHFKKGDNYPVEQVRWGDAVEFCKKLSAKEGRTYRLPTEAEWEYACRAGTTTPFAFGETISTDQANCDGRYAYGGGTKGQYRKCTTAVGSFKPNAWGLYDMHGNVWEWCQDWYAEDSYRRLPEVDPTGPDSGSSRVLRGGSWLDEARDCRAASRYRNTPDDRSSCDGFRVVCVVRVHAR